MSNLHKQRVLVLCTGNSCRSQMAEGWLRALGDDRFDVFSAGSAPADRVHPLAVRVMAEAGIDISGGRPKPLTNFLSQPFDVVISVCDDANEVCPVFPGGGQRIHHGFFDPAKATGSENEKLVVFRRVRDEIRQWVEEYCGRST